MAAPTTIPSQAANRGAPGAAPRLVSLDAFRGLTIAGMILVNNPGGSVYWPLEHAEWNGWTPTDLIFPFFLFIVGTSMMFSFVRRREQADRRRLFGHVLYRSAMIFAIGLFLNAFPFFDAHTVRIPGVLQRIALCYLAGAAVVLTTRRRGRIITVAALLIGYWALMRFVPVPGYGIGRLDPDGNFAAYIDRAIFGHHTWHAATWDPEGLLSTLPAIATVLFGTFAGDWLRSSRSLQRKVVGLLIAGVIGIVVGRALHPLFPINKNLWTSSFTIFTAGFASICFGVCYWAIDVRGWRRWAEPLVVYGVNPIVAYAASSLLTKALVYTTVVVRGERVSNWHLIFRTCFEPLAGPKMASLLFSSAYVLLWLAIAWVMYAKKIFVKI